MERFNHTRSEMEKNSVNPQTKGQDISELALVDDNH
jgi:hypothetical protein